MQFTQTEFNDRITRAHMVREPIALTVEEVGDLAESWPAEEEVMQEWIEKLGDVDVRGLRVTRKAQQAIAEALGLDAGDIWS